MSTATLDRPEIADDAREIVPESAAPLVKFSITEKFIAEARSRHAALVALPTIPEDSLRRELTTLVRARTAIDDERLRQGAVARQFLKDINDKAKEVTAELAPLESDLQKRWDAIVAEKARVKREAEEKRQKALQDEIDAKNRARQAELDAQAEENRVAREALAEAKRKIQEQQDAADAKRRDEQRIEDERKAAEREKQRQDDEAAAQKERDRLKKIDDEQKARQAELDRKQKEIDDAAEVVRLAKEKQDREDFERKAQIEADRKAKEQAETDRIAAEEAKVKEAERLAELKKRIEAMKPDIEKARSFIETVRGAVCGPMLNDQTIASAVDVAREKIHAACDDLGEWLESQESKQLKRQIRLRPHLEQFPN